MPTCAPRRRRVARGAQTARVALAAVLAAVAVFSTALFVVPEATTASASPAEPMGYWLVASDGGVFTFGGVPFAGSGASRPLPAPVVGMAATPDGGGYWLASADGTVLAFGDAPFAGSPAAYRPASPMVGVASTPTGRGYWVVAADGGVFSFGDAAFHGSTGGIRLTRPIVGMTATPDGGGYWLVASDGGIFAFGDAVFRGSTGGIRLAQPVVGMSATPDGLGYWMVASDGGIFAFGDAVFQGSTGGIRLDRPVVGMASTFDGNGYWLVASDGGIFAFGDAVFRGSTGGVRLNRPIVAMAAGHTLDPYPPGYRGYDISWPQCGNGYPPGGATFAIVGVNGGRSFTHNPCFASELAWARASSVISVYINLNFPPAGDPAQSNGPAGTCAIGDGACLAYNYGYNSALDAYSYGTSNGAPAGGVWWVDVETANSWSSNQFWNSRTVQGALDALTHTGAVPGIYSTYLQFPAITGDYHPGGPIWVPYSDPAHHAMTDYCTDPTLGFAGGKPWLVQFQTTGVPFDQNQACP